MKFKIVVELVNENGKRIGADRFATDLIDIDVADLHLTPHDAVNLLQRGGTREEAGALDRRRDAPLELIQAAGLVLMQKVVMVLRETIELR